MDRQFNNRALLAYTDGAVGAARNDAVQAYYRNVTFVSTPIDRDYERHAMFFGERAWLNNVAPIDQLIWALSAPLTELDRNPPEITQATFNAADWTSKAFSGRTFNDAARAFNDYAIKHGFSDGLPLVVPTTELVEEMLTGTTRAPGEVLGMLKMRGGIITIEKIAINAVMAGARPEYLPVIIAAMEAYAGGWEFDKMWYHPMTSGGPFGLGILVSGPLTDEIGISSTTGWAGAGNEATNTIGRAIRLCIRNIGHNTTPYVDTNNRQGRMNDFTLITFAENLYGLPAGWRSHSEMMGFAPGSTTVTLFGFNGRTMVGYGDEAQHPMAGLRASRANRSGNTNISIIPPSAAHVLATRYGMDTKEDIKEWHATHNTAGEPTARSAGIFANTHVLVVGSDPGGFLSFPGFMLYGQNLVNTTQLVSGATLTTYGRGATVPSTPQNFTVDYTYSGGVRTHATLRWDAPLADGGMPVTGYQVNWIHGGNRQTAPWTDVPGGAYAREFTVELVNTHLAPTLVDRRGDVGVYEFFFKVRATNEVVNTSEIVANAVSLNRMGGRGAWAMNPVDITDRTGVFSLRAFNNGTCTEVPDLAGRIRIWPQLNGASVPMPMSAVITAVDQDGDDAIQLITRNRQWVDGEGWQNYYINFDVDKSAPWQTILLTITAFGQTVDVLLVNNLFDDGPVTVFGLNAFNNGNDSNASLANLGVIRVWTQLDGANALVPYAGLTVTAYDQDDVDAMEFVRVNRIWNNLDYVNMIDITKRDANWRYIDLTVELGGQTVELLLINNTIEL